MLSRRDIFQYWQAIYFKRETNMIDWSQCRVEDFSLVVDGDEIQQVGQTQLFPVRVFYKGETFAFIKSV